MSPKFNYEIFLLSFSNVSKALTMQRIFEMYSCKYSDFIIDSVRNTIVIILCRE